MEKVLTVSLLVLIISFVSIQTPLAQKVMIGPRITGNYTVYNQQNDNNSWNGIGVGIGGTVDLSFTPHLGILTNLTVFDMRNFSTSITNNQTTTEYSYTLSYLALDPMFKAEFSGFYMVGGPSIGIKLAGSGQKTITTVGRTPTVTPINNPFNSVRFDIAVGTGYNFMLSPNLALASDFMVYIPLSNTFDFPGLSNSTLSLKLGAALKFRL